MASFLDLGIKASYIKSIKELGISNPSEIQELTIPILLKGKTDFIGLAQTGTGKTAAFGLPLLQHIDASSDNIQTLILSPTRELVQQIKKQLFKFTKYGEEKIFIEAVFGGEKIDKEDFDDSVSILIGDKKLSISNKIASNLYIKAHTGQ